MARPSRIWGGPGWNREPAPCCNGIVEGLRRSMLCRLWSENPLRRARGQKRQLPELPRRVQPHASAKENLTALRVYKKGAFCRSKEKTLRAIAAATADQRSVE